MTKVRAEHYNYRTSWSEEDNEFLGLCEEFPLMSNLAPTSLQALSGMQDLVATVLKDMEAEGVEPPAPRRFGLPSDPGDHDIERASRSAKTVASQFAQVVGPRRLTDDDEDLLAAKVEAAILAAVAMKGEELQPWEKAS